MAKQPQPTLDYTQKGPRRNIRRYIFALTTLLFFAYVSGYVWLRCNRSFIHYATGYTSETGWQRTDYVDLNHDRFFPKSFAFIHYGYTPLRWAESAVWRMMPNPQKP